MEINLNFSAFKSHFDVLKITNLVGYSYYNHFLFFLFCLDEHFDNRTGNNSFENLNKNENEVLLECSEDVPFSPLRQSYTPLPMNQSNGNDDVDVDDDLITPDCIPSARNYDSENELHIIDIKLNDHQMLDANDDDQHSNEHENMPFNKDDVVLFTINTANDGMFYIEFALNDNKT